MYRLALVLALLAAGTLVDASAGVFMKFDGIDGEATDDRHKGWIDVLSVSWAMDKRVSPGSGLATGKRQHKPLTITKEIDKATPLLMQVCSNGKPSNVEIELTRRSPTGGEETYLKITMQDVIVSSYSMGVDGGAQEGPGGEVVSLTYSKITWTWTDGSVEYQDDWVAPK